MAGESKTAAWGIRINAESNAGEAANSVEALLKQISRSQDAVKSYGSSLAKLRGSSDEVKEGSEKLKAAKEAEREAISRATVQLAKMGLTYGDASKASRDASTRVKEAAKAQEEAVKKAAEAQKTAAEKAKTAADANTKAAQKEWAEWSKALGIISGAAIGIVAAITGVVVVLGKFVIENANALRTMSLFREAATGSAENARAFGHQIDALGDKIPTSREELNKLSVDMSRALVNTRISGAGIVDTFNAVAQTSAAMGDSAGKAIESIVDRGKLLGRLGIGLNELQGTGIAFQDVASQLASNLKIGINQAQLQLRLGRVRIDDGAKALRQVVEKRFAGINLRRMLDINVLATKFRDNLQRLTEDINLEPLLGGFQKLMGLFSQNTVTGQALKKIITSFGDAMTKVFKFIAPLAEKFFKQLVIETLKFEIAIIRVKKWVDSTFGKEWASKIDLATVAITAAKVAFGIFATAIVSAATAVALLTAAFVGVMKVIEAASGIAKRIGEAFKSVGAAIVEGIKAGIEGSRNAAIAPIIATAERVKNAFKNALGIHSPSAVFAEFGRMTSEGYKRGVDESGRDANRATERLTTPPTIGVTRPNSSGENTNASVTVNLQFPNVKDGKQVAASIDTTALKAAITKVFEEALKGRGVPIEGGG